MGPGDTHLRKLYKQEFVVDTASSVCMMKTPKQINSTKRVMRMKIKSTWYKPSPQGRDHLKDQKSFKPKFTKEEKLIQAYQYARYMAGKDVPHSSNIKYSSLKATYCPNSNTPSTISFNGNSLYRLNTIAIEEWKEMNKTAICC